MQIYVLATIALAAISTVQARSVNTELTGQYSTGTGDAENEAGVASIFVPVADWQACTEEVGCETTTSVCVRHSEYYAQCKPAELPSGDLCGQDDGTNVWKYDRCPADEKCAANGTDFRCMKPEMLRRPNLESSATTVSSTITEWGDCTQTGSVCTAGSTCVKHSSFYSQCKPAILPTGGLCGQSTFPNIWKYDGHCSAGETCQASGGDFHCRSTTATTFPVTATSPTGITYVLDWESCTKPNQRCKTTTSSCIKFSDFYSQCLPETLSSGSLCGQTGANNWRYDHCPTGDTCKTSGSDSRCAR